jgi:VWFA-related protein
MRKCKNLLLRALVFGIPTAGLCQQPAVVQKAPVLRSTSELVLVPAAVTDSHGRPRAGLTCADFTVFDNGIEQQPASCDEIAPPSAPPATVQPETAHTNRPGQARTQGLLIVALDFINSPTGDVARMRDAALRFLSTNVPSDQPIEVVALTWKGVRVIHSFTTDSRVLEAAIDRVLKRGGRRDASAGADERLVSIEANAIVDDATENVDAHAHNPHPHEAAGYARDQQWRFVTATLANLAEIANGFAGVPGRKSLLWASSGFPFAVPDPTSMLPASVQHLDYEFVEKYNQLWKLLNGANVAVYPVSLTGITRGSTEEYDVGHRRARLAPYEPPLYDREEQSKMTFLTFASATGGRACVEDNDIAECFRNAEAESRSYYLLTFRVDRTTAKPGWHTLKVEVKKPGTHVRARSAYLLGDPDAPAQTTPYDQLLAATRSPLEYTGVVFEIAWEQPAHPQHPANVGFALTVPPDGVPASPTQPVNLRVFAVPMHASVAVQSQLEPVDLRLDGPALDQFRQSGVSLHGQLALPPECDAVKFLVIDRNSGVIGSLEVPLAGK